MNIDLVKKYGLIGITVVITMYGIYLLWFLYNAIYQPLFIDTSLLPDSNKYEIPDSQINKVKSLLQTKTENRVEIPDIRNPFVAHGISQPETDTDTILDSPINDGELGRPE